MESNWRFYRELIGMGGPIFGLPGEQGIVLRFAARLNPPLNTGSGLMTWLLVGPRQADGIQRWYMGNLDTLGFFVFGLSGVKPNAERFPFGWTVDPDPA